MINILRAHYIPDEYKVNSFFFRLTVAYTNAYYLSARYETFHYVLAGLINRNESYDHNCRMIPGHNTYKFNVLTLFMTVSCKHPVNTLGDLSPRNCRVN
jgi:hypothetical protein